MRDVRGQAHPQLTLTAIIELRGGSLHLSRSPSMSSAPFFPFTGAFQDTIPAGWLCLGGEGISPSGSTRLRLVRRIAPAQYANSPSNPEEAVYPPTREPCHPNRTSIDARAVLVTDANGSLTKSASGGQQTATRNARPLFATITNAGADAPSAGFGDLLRDHRRAAGLTQEQLAERAGVSQRSISDMERGGQHIPRRDTVTLLVRALDLSRPEREAFEGLVERSRRLRPMPDRTAIHQAPLITESAFERPKHNLPRSLTSLVGREQELVELDRLLATAPLLTLVGAGGIGKTRLAQELVRNHVASYPDGSWLIELARLADPSLVPSAVAAALGLHDIDARNITSTLAST